MDKKGIARAIRRKTKGVISYSKAYNIVGITLDVMKEGLLRDGKVTIYKFGNFYLRKIQPKRLMDIHSRTIIVLPARNKVVFKPSPQLLELVKEK